MPASNFSEKTQLPVQRPRQLCCAFLWANIFVTGKKASPERQPARQKSIPNIYRLNIHYFITQWLSRGKTKWMKNSNGMAGESSSTTVNHHQIASTELPFDFSVCVLTRFFFRGGKTHWKAGLHLIFLWGSWKSVARLENVYILKGGCCLDVNEKTSKES